MYKDFKKYGFLLSNEHTNLCDNKDLNKLLLLARRRILIYKLVKILGINKLLILFKRKILGIKTPKVFLVEILRKGDFKRIQALRKISNHEKIISRVKAYLGDSAKLTGCGLWYSEPVKGKYSKSQLFHLDKPGDYIKVFIALSNIKNDNGPFTFIDSENSRKLITSNKINQNSKKDKLDKYEDNYIYSEFNQNFERKFLGKFGNIIFCDTTRCLHLGSRVRKGYRLMLMLVYSLNNMEKDKASIILK